MFMYAAGRAVAARTGSCLVLNVSGFSRDTLYKRVFVLDQFPITAEILPDSWWTRILGPVDRVVAGCPWLAPGLAVVRERSCGWRATDAPAFSSIARRKSVSLRGYWQDERYFQDCAGIIRGELAPPVPVDQVAVRELARIHRSTHPVAIGVRFYGEVPGESSNPAGIIDAFRRSVVAHAAREPGCDYFVFTTEPGYFDDPRCLGVKFTIITHRPRNEDAPTDLYLMSQCRSFFIGYSSFHWWGAWLGGHPCKTVAYLKFPGRPGANYAAAGWSTVEV
jgi:hypothetical protein